MPDLKLTARNGEPRRVSVSSRHESTDAGRRPWASSIFALAIAAVLTFLGVANIVLRAVDGTPVQAPADVVAYQHRAHEGTELSYSLVRLGTQQALQVSLSTAS